MYEYLTQAVTALGRVFNGFEPIILILFSVGFVLTIINFLFVFILNVGD